MEKRNNLALKAGALQRFLIWKYVQPVLKNIRIAEFPKSGGTWLSQMLSECFEMEFPRNRHLPLKSCIHQSHIIGPTNYKTILLTRDGRDVFVSSYFHFLIDTNTKPKGLVESWRDRMGRVDLDDVTENMPKFISVFSNTFSVGGKKTNWSDHTKSYLKFADNLLLVKYEDLLKNSETELKRILEFYNYISDKDLTEIVSKYSFERLSHRKKGTEDKSSFLRKGIAGDWKNHFNDEALKVYYQLHGEVHQALGYD